MSKKISFISKPPKKDIDKLLDEWVKGEPTEREVVEPDIRTTLKLPASIHKQLKLKSIELSKPVNNILLEIIEEFLEKDN